MSLADSEAISTNTLSFVVSIVVVLIGAFWAVYTRDMGWLNKILESTKREVMDVKEELKSVREQIQQLLIKETRHEAKSENHGGR